MPVLAGAAGATVFTGTACLVTTGFATGTVLATGCLTAGAGILLATGFAATAGFFAGGAGFTACLGAGFGAGLAATLVGALEGALVLATGLPGAFLAGFAFAAGLEAFLATVLTFVFTTGLAAFLAGAFTAVFGLVADLPGEAFFAVFVLAIVGTLLQVRQDVASARKRISPVGTDPCFWKGRTLPDSIGVCHNLTSVGEQRLIMISRKYSGNLYRRWVDGNSCSSINT